jgi:hypothetical protein
MSSRFRFQRFASPFASEKDEASHLAPHLTIRHNGVMKPDTVTASEIGDFVYCEEAWRLSALGHPSSNQAVRDHGTAHYAQKVAAEPSRAAPSLSVAS